MLCLCTVQGLHAINLGNSGFIVIRDGCTVFESPVQQHGFNFPYQLENGTNGDLPSSGQVLMLCFSLHTSFLNLGNAKITTCKQQTNFNCFVLNVNKVFNVPVTLGDVIVTGFPPNHSHLIANQIRVSFLLISSLDFINHGNTDQQETKVCRRWGLLRGAQRGPNENLQKMGEKGRRIRELTSVVQKRFKFPDNSVELYAEKVNNRGLCAIAQAESLRYKLLGGLAVRSKFDAFYANLVSEDDDIDDIPPFQQTYESTMLFI
ncbi:hypothetical protein GIB67_035567 [Kingdonia uniflora]|uniref:Ribosomal protein S3 n=1 Tax=Kingdonia uniflora TaxID=39325 RepID=A0A7J7LDC2_9MAGN|nr:hypothetical protein GIB67_035567 [Kingdonia uniflora]